MSWRLRSANITAVSAAFLVVTDGFPAALYARATAFDIRRARLAASVRCSSTGEALPRCTSGCSRSAMTAVATA